MTPLPHYLVSLVLASNSFTIPQSPDKAILMCHNVLARQHNHLSHATTRHAPANVACARGEAAVVHRLLTPDASLATLFNVTFGPTLLSWATTGTSGCHVSRHKLPHHHTTHTTTQHSTQLKQRVHPSTEAQSISRTQPRRSDHTTNWSSSSTKRSGWTRYMWSLSCTTARGVHGDCSLSLVAMATRHWLQ